MKFCDFVPQALWSKDWAKLKPFLSETYINTLHLEEDCVVFYIGLDSDGPYIKVKYTSCYEERKLHFLQALDEDFFDVFSALIIPEMGFPTPESYLSSVQLCFIRLVEVWDQYAEYKVVFGQAAHEFISDC